MHVRKFSISLKIVLIILVLLLVSDCMIGLFVYHKTKDSLVTQIKENAKNIDKCVAASVDGSLITEIQDGDTESEAYQTILSELSLYLDNSGVEYVYTIKDTGNGTSNFIVDSDPEEPGLPGEDFGETSEEIAAAYAGETTTDNEPYTDKWGTHISAYSPIYNGDEITALAVVDLSFDWINEQTKEIAILIIVVCSIAFIAGILILLLISRSLHTGFSKLNTKVAELSNGDGDLTKEIDTQTGDEFETIGGNVNELLRYIREIMLSIHKSSDSLKQISEQLKTNVNGAGINAGGISNTMQTLTATMEETDSSLQQISNFMDEIIISFDDIVKKIQNGVNYSHEMMTQAVETGNTAIEEQQSAHDRVEQMKVSVTEKIAQSKAVEQINILTDNILSITQQTNLLSLNASIEAARAGEAGKGFAVVASEIGNLATDSAKAASEIQAVSTNVISTVEELAREAQEMIEFINEAVLKGYGNLVDTSHQYRDSAKHIDEMMQEFSEISTKIQSDINAVQNSTGSANIAVDEATNAIIDTTEKTVDLTNDLREIEEQAKQSEAVAEALYTEVSKFQLQ